MPAKIIHSDRSDAVRCRIFLRNVTITLQHLICRLLRAIREITQEYLVIYIIIKDFKTLKIYINKKKPIKFKIRQTNIWR